MNLIKKDMWGIPDADALCITTNGFVKRDGSAVMGRGCAREAMQKFPGIEKRLAQRIKHTGNVPNIINMNPRIISFPVKPIQVHLIDKKVLLERKRNDYHIGQVVPGFYCKAQLDIIKLSAEWLKYWADHANWKKVILPRPGCGNGELSWSIVEEVLDKYLDARFLCVYK